MKKSLLVGVAVILLVAGMVVVGVSQQEPYVSLKITTRLGVEATFKAGTTKVENDLLGRILGDNARIPIQLAPRVYASVPPFDLKEGIYENGGLSLQLTSGATLKGQGTGSLKSDSGASFGMNTIARLAVVEMTKDWDSGSRKEKIVGDKWKLTTAANGQVFEIRQPRFVFSYYSTSGYAIGGSTRVEADEQNFWLKLKSEELEATLESFRSVQIVAGAATAPPSITVTAPNGTVTTGPLVVKTTDRAGTHESSVWGIHGLLEGTQRTSIVVIGAPVSLERVP